MKKISVLVFLFLAIRLSYSAPPPPPVQDVGSQSELRVNTIAVSTKAAILLSTGIYNPCIPGFVQGTRFSSDAVKGDFLCGRIYLEIRNDSPYTIWMGTWVGVSTMAQTPTQMVNPAYGISIPSFTARIDSDGFPNWYVVGGTTSFPVTIIQKK